MRARQKAHSLVCSQCSMDARLSGEEQDKVADFNGARREGARSREAELKTA